MKNISAIICFSALLLFSSGCEKDSSNDSFAVIDREKSQIKNALDLTQAFSDTLVSVYDTVIAYHLNPICLYYDSLFHRSDSMFSAHYMMFGDEMYKNGMMMNGYSPMGGMMNGGMMDPKRMMEDTTLVGGYYREMHQLNDQHLPYHNGIFN